MPSLSFTPGISLTPEMMLVALAISGRVGVPLTGVVVAPPDENEEFKKRVGLSGQRMNLLVVFKGSVVAWTWADENGRQWMGSNADGAQIVP